MLYYAILLEITGGMDHAEMTEDRCENLMDFRARWNVDFLMAEKESRCIAAERVYYLLPQNQIFTPSIVRTLQRTRRDRGRRRWLASFKDILSSAEYQSNIPEATIWHLLGRAHFWKLPNGRYAPDFPVFVEYDAEKQHGYALIFYCCLFEANTYKNICFPHALNVGCINDVDFQLLCNHW